LLQPGGCRSLAAPEDLPQKNEDISSGFLT
jgi:hypothetical protein